MINRLLQFRPSTRLPAWLASWASKSWAGELVVLDWVITLALACSALLAGGLLWIVIGARDPTGGMYLNQLSSAPVSLLLKLLIVWAGIALLAAVVVWTLVTPEPPQSPEVEQ